LNYSILWLKKVQNRCKGNQKEVFFKVLTLFFFTDVPLWLAFSANLSKKLQLLLKKHR